MAEHRKQKLHIGIVAISLFLVLGIGLGFIGVSSARYQYNGIISTLYGEPQNPSTLDATCKIYDFGCWELGGEDLEATVVLQQSAPLKGSLKFYFDSTTTEKKDIALQLSTGSGKEVAVDEEDGRLDFPFSLILSAQSRSGLAYLNVEWTPTGAQKATKSARYIIALNPDSLCANATASPKFDSSDGFLTNNLFHISFKMPSGASGIYVAQGVNLNGAFQKGTVYYNKTYPQGVTLLRNSVIFHPDTSAELEELLINRNSQSSSGSYKVTVGSSAEHQAEISLTPKSNDDVLKVSASNKPIVNQNKPLTITVSEPSSLKDSKWNDGQTSSAQLSWELQKLMGGIFSKIAQSENIKVAVTQNDNGGKLVISVPNGKQPAGTYQLVIKQTYNGCEVNISTVRFFVDYR